MKCLSYPFLYKKPGSRATDLALIKPDCIHQSFHRTVQVGIVEHDVGRFSSQFESQFLYVTRGGLPDFASHISGTGEGNLIRLLMSHDHFAHPAVSGNDVDDSSRQSRLDANLGKK